ncbi:MAG: hypothetical protein LBI18_15425 [Planctomycetaceae bacterium]|jgi:hypothetical protein|nr:hypothetical protein [Planctomycetaceae bacterium]
MKILATFLIGRIYYFLGLIICVFVLPLYAQPSAGNGYPLQDNTKLSGTVSSHSDSTKSDTNWFYLLRTGFLTEGIATNDGKQYLLKTNFGTMSVPAANVEFVGATREEVYDYKKGLVNDRDCNDLIKLAEWCFNNKLTTQGIAEYQRALQTAPNAVLAEVIRNRLEMLRDSTSEPTGLSGVQTVLSQSSFSEASGNIIGNTNSNTDMKRWANGIPKPIIDSFAKKVQPVLVSRCAASDCHGSSSENQLKLNIPSHTFGNTTYRNLGAVLQWIDFDYPMESQLLSVSVAYHGGTKAAFSVESAQYNNIVQWVRLVSKELPTEYRSQFVHSKSDNHNTANNTKNNTNIAESVGNEYEFPLKGDFLPSTLRNAMIAEPPPPKITQPEIPTTFLLPKETPTRSNPSNISGQSNSVAISERLFSNLPSADLPLATDLADSVKDPFDPHIFNNRYHGNVNRLENDRKK